MTTSPIASGPGGASFESAVGTGYLISLLTGGSARGGVLGTTQSVGLQRAGSGAPLDDVIVGIDGANGRCQLHLQVKRALTCTASDAEFSAAIAACWTTFRDPALSDPTNRLGIGVGEVAAKVTKHFARIPDWARMSTDATEFGRFNRPGLASAEMREFVDTVRSILVNRAVGGLNDETLWNFFRRFVIVQFDYQLDLATSRDSHVALDSLRHIVPGHDLTGARALLNELTSISVGLAQAGGKLDVAGLRGRLAERGFQLVAPPLLAADFHRIEDHSSRALSDADLTIAGMMLDRDMIATQVTEALDRGAIVVLTGAAGMGKSAVMRAVAERRRASGPLFALSAQRLAGVVGWDGLAERLQVGARLSDLIAALASNAHPCLCIDGIDQITEDGARRAVNDILAAIAAMSAGTDGSGRWCILLTTRSERLGAVREWLRLPTESTTTVEVSSLTEQELATLSSLLPHMRHILSSDHVGPVIRNLYFLSILARAANAAQSDHSVTPREYTEASVLQVWWDRIVGVDQGARQDTLLALGRTLLTASTLALSTDDCDADVLASLIVDGIIRRDSGTDTYWFGHDILREWVLCRVLSRYGTDLSSRVRTATNRHLLLDALQLLGAERIERDSTGEQWRNLYASLAMPSDTPSDGPALAVLRAPFRSDGIVSLLQRMSSVLLANDGERLAELLRAMRTEHIVPNPILANSLATMSLGEPLSAEHREALLFELGLPLWPIWHPVLSWLAPMLNDLPIRARGEASHAMVTWQRMGVPELPFRVVIGRAALSWRAVLTPTDGHRVHVGRELQGFYDRLRDIVCYSADAISAEIPRFLESLRETEDEHSLAMWLGQSPQAMVARFAPTAYVDFTLDVLIPGWRDQPADPGAVDGQANAADQSADPETPWGEIGFGENPSRLRRLRDRFGSGFLFPSHLRGPFYSLLQTNESEGLRLVNTLLRVATDDYERARYAVVAPAIQFPFYGTVEALKGDGESYRWFRPMGNAPYPVAAALMALEVWMEGQISSGRNPQELFRTVIAGSGTTSAVAVCVAMVLAFPEVCLAVAEPFVTNPWLLEWDTVRASMDSHGTIATSLEWTGRRDLAEDAQIARDNRPQRRAELRSVVPSLLFSDDAGLAERIATAFRRFPDNLSLLSEQERQDSSAVAAFRHHMERLAALGNPENYRLEQHGAQHFVVMEMPQHIQERDAPLAAANDRVLRILSLHAWANRSLDAGALASGRSVAEGLALARALEADGGFDIAIDGTDGHLEYTRIEAIIETACVVLRYGDQPLDDGLVEWCRTAILHGTRVRVVESLDMASLAVPQIRQDTAIGLMLLLEHGDESAAVREATFAWSHINDHDVRDCILGRLHRVWAADNSLATNIIASHLALSTIPRDAIASSRHRFGPTEAEQGALDQVRIGVMERYVDNIRARTTPGAFGVSRFGGDTVEFAAFLGDSPIDLNTYGHFSPDAFLSALTHVPVAHLGDTGIREWAVAASTAVFRWIIAAYDAEYQSSHSSSSHLDLVAGKIADWVAILLSVATQSEETAIMDQLRTSWPATANLTGGVLAAVSRRYLVADVIAPTTHRLWRTIAEWLLAPDTTSSSNWRTRRDEEDAIRLLVHVRYGRCILTEHWTGAPTLIDVYDRWVAKWGQTEWGYTALLAFLDAGGKSLDALHVLEWLETCTVSQEDLSEWWTEDGRGASTAALLSRLLRTDHDRIVANHQCLRSITQLLDGLVLAGIPVAAALRAQL